MTLDLNAIKAVVLGQPILDFTKAQDDYWRDILSKIGGPEPDAVRETISPGYMRYLEAQAQAAVDALPYLVAPLEAKVKELEGELEARELLAATGMEARRDLEAALHTYRKSAEEKQEQLLRLTAAHQTLRGAVAKVVEEAYREGWGDGMREAPTDLTRAGRIEDHWPWSDAHKAILPEATMENERGEVQECRDLILSRFTGADLQRELEYPKTLKLLIVGLILSRDLNREEMQRLSAEVEVERKAEVAVRMDERQKVLQEVANEWHKPGDEGGFEFTSWLLKKRTEATND